MEREQATETQLLFWRAREKAGLSRAELIDAANRQPEAVEPVPDELPRYLETRIAAVPRNLGPMKAIARALGLRWDDVLATMGLR